MIFVCSIISVLSASYYSEVNLHCFVKLFKFRGTRIYALGLAWMVISVVLPNLYKSVKILSTSSTIIWSRDIKVFCFVFMC
jgi:hypothetical protein